jgi:hypothetical protein
MADIIANRAELPFRPICSPSLFRPKRTVSGYFNYFRNVPEAEFRDPGKLAAELNQSPDAAACIWALICGRSLLSILTPSQPVVLL